VTKCIPAIILCDENDKHYFLCLAHAAQHLSGKHESLASVDIELACSGLGDGEGTLLCLTVPGSAKQTGTKF
jgi:hypothetical protein